MQELLGGKAIIKLFNRSKNFLQKINTDHLFLVLSIAVYSYLVILWHNLNNGLPTSDAVDYLNNAFLRYYNFFDHGFINGVVELYTKRGWRPQIFPIFSVPFLILFGNNPFNAVIGVSVFFASLLIYYLYLLLRINLTPLYSAVITLLIATFPVIFKYNLIFFSEVSYTPLFLATFYHLSKSDYFSNHRHSILAGIFVGFLTCIRPAESIVFLSLALIPFMVIAAKRNNLGLKEILTSLNIAFGTIVLLFYITYILPNAKIILVPFLVLAAYAIKKLRSLYEQKGNCFVIFTSALCIIIFIYWMPAVAALVNWSIEASIGSVVKSLNVANSVSIPQFILSVFYEWQFLGMTLLVFLPIIFLPSNYKSAINKNNLILLMAAILPLIFLAISYKFSINDNQIPRRSLGIVLLIFVCLAGLIYNKKMRFKSLSLVVLTMMLLINLITILSTTLIGENNSFSERMEKVGKKMEIASPLYAKYRNNLPTIPHPYKNKIDKQILLVDKITRNICKYDNRDCLSKYRSFFVTEPIYSNNNENTIDPFAAGFASLLRRNVDKFHFGFVFVPSDEDHYEAMKKREVNFVIIQDRKNISEKELNAKNLSYSQKFTAELLKEYRENKKFKRLKLIDSFEIYDTEILVLANPDVPV